MLFPVPYRPTFFAPDEIVPERVYVAARDLAELLYPTDDAAQKEYLEFIIFSLFEPKLLESLDWLRERYGPCTINNWSSGGSNHFRGLRMPESRYYSKGSMHSLTGDRKVGACDCSFNCTAEEVRQDVLKREANGETIPFTRMEGKVSWVHVDTKPTGKNGVYIFNP